MQRHYDEVSYVGNIEGFDSQNDQRDSEEREYNKLAAGRIDQRRQAYVDIYEPIDDDRTVAEDSVSDGYDSLKNSIYEMMDTDDNFDDIEGVLGALDENLMEGSYSSESLNLIESLDEAMYQHQDYSRRVERSVEKFYGLVEKEVRKASKKTRKSTRPVDKNHNYLHGLTVVVTGDFRPELERKLLV